MTTYRVQHHGNQIVSVAAVPTTDSAAATGAFATDGRYYTRQVDAAEVERMYGAPPAASTADSPRANAMTPAQMNALARAHFRR